MSPLIHNCPLCGSGQIALLEPDPFQSRAGVGWVLKCECGAISAITVLKEPATKVDKASGAIWKSTCGSCGKRHTFYFRDAEILPQDQAFEYECPKTGETALYTAADCEWSHVDAAKPADAVHLRMRT
jgi:hypothetical protein